MKAFFNGVWALAVVGGTVVGIAFGLREGLSWLFADVDPTIGAAIVAAAATTVVSVLGVALGRYFERRQKIELEIRERKIPVYQGMVEGLLTGLLDSEEDDTSALEAVFKEITPQLITWASDDVIAAWAKFKRDSGESEPIALMFQFEEVLMAVRRDLGHATKNLSKGDLLGLFINDIHEHLGAQAT
ncbi:MAG: hypothetical protein JWP74_2178 [Marmoricola sp.]|nr:hypothetical protein [Marmoricola sp.]